MEKEIKNPEIKQKKLAYGVFVSLRFVAAGFSLASACFMVTNKQTTIIYGIEMVAKYSYSSAFRFMAFANVVVCGFALVSMILSLFCRKGMTPNVYFLFFLHDLAATALEMAACAAATTVGFIGRYGNDHTGWMPICDHMESFCNRATTSVTLSYMAFASFICLTIVSASCSRNVGRHQSFNSV